MSVYVDPIRQYDPKMIKGPQTQRNGINWCHLFADTVEELHQFANRLGLRRSWFQDKSHPHYDLTPNKQLQALRAGAEPITLRKWLRG